MKQNQIDEKEVHISHETTEDTLDINEFGVRRPCQRLRVATLHRGDSLTIQSDADAADIHQILDRAKKTGLLPQVTSRSIDTDNLPSVESFHEAMNIIAHSKQQFENLPSDVRQAFGNDASNLLAAVHDPKQHEKLVELGLANAPQKLQDGPEGQGAKPPAAPAPSAPQNAGVGEGAAPAGGK